MARRVLVVVGTRPEAIKMAPVVRALRTYAPELDTSVALTGQHHELVRELLGTLGLEPDHDLAIMKAGQSVYHVVHQALDGLRAVVREFEPDVILVQGDTATVFSGALVGYLERVKVGHVEAGLRSHDKWAPYPEEIFRRLTDVVADYHFAPTARARAALLAESVSPDTVWITGNTVVDALHDVADHTRAPRNSELGAALEGGRRLVLVTAHRRESFGEKLAAMFRAFRQLADEIDDIELLYPLHPNPHVTEPAREILADHPRIRLTAPLDYLDLVSALRGASLILTDSGGIQEEAPTFGKPVLVLRDVTERPEGIEAGVAELVGTDPTRIVERARAALAAPLGEPPPNPYGDGRASERIADILRASLTGAPRGTKDWEPPS